MCDYGRYESCVIQILDKPIESWSFKSSPSYTYVLEHVNVEQGNNYLKFIKEEFSDIYDKKLFKELCDKNDNIGRPNRYIFQDFGLISPTNLRYIYQSLRILKDVRKYSISDSPEEVDIVEVGGGYGGLCFFIHSLSKLFNIRVKSYTIFDLPVVSKLQLKYTEALGISIRILNVDSSFILNADSYFVSSYCFSEISKEYQEKYSERVLSCCSHGFIAWNYIPVYNFVKGEIIVQDHPYGNGNYYVWF